MNPNPEDLTLHECSEKDRFKRLEDLILTNGVPSRLAVIEEKVRWILRLNAGIFLAIVGAFVAFIIKSQ